MRLASTRPCSETLSGVHVFCRRYRLWEPGGVWRKELRCHCSEKPTTEETWAFQEMEKLAAVEAAL